MSVRRSMVGGCLCGEIRFEATGSFRDVTLCHCRMCQRAHSAPAVPWVTVRRASYRVTQGVPARYQSSAKAARTFCAACGSHLRFEENGRPDQVDVAVAALDDAASLRPVRHIWMESRLAGYAIDEDLPSFPQGAPTE